MELREIKWSHRRLGWGEGDPRVRVETIMQTYYDQQMTGIAIHLDGPTEEVLELEKDIRALIKKRQMVSHLKKEDEEK